MRLSFTFLLLFSFCGLMLGQQDEQYTQFMYNKMAFNAAYAGSGDGTCITALGKAQWLGFEGAPETQLVTFNMPLLNKRIGIGASIYRQTIGITENLSAEAVYAYRIRMGRGTLSLGVQGSVRLLRANFSEVEATQSVDQDGAIPNNIQSKFIPNFGAGVYFKSNSFYMGVSIPRLLENNIDFADTGDIISTEVRHMYLMGGFTIELNELVQMQPQLLLKYVAGAPFDGDINTNFIFDERYTIGASYRLGGSRTSGIGESVSLLLGLQISDDLFFGASYDMTLSELRKYNSGSVEAILFYCIGGRSQGEEFISPRFF
ncbi:MAG: type IX secretion system membrane protein PorP/SprF [Saprospiraceae bacterium]|nr:type IX secretion system membrane protein PorP/SprF [Saprospiraceae bacterium]